MKVAIALAMAAAYLPDWVYGKETVLKFCLTYAIIRSMSNVGKLKA